MNSSADPAGSDNSDFVGRLFLTTIFSHCGINILFTFEGRNRVNLWDFGLLFSGTRTIWFEEQE